MSVESSDVLADQGGSSTLLSPIFDKKNVSEYLHCRLAQSLSSDRKQIPEEDAEEIVAFVVQQLGVELSGINYEQYQLLCRGIEMAADEFCSEYQNGKIDAETGKNVFFFLIRRLIDVYRSPILAKKNGEDVDLSSLTDIEHVRVIVHDCIESEREALYWTECARMDVSDVISRNGHQSISNGCSVYAHVNMNLDEAVSSLNCKTNEGVLRRIEDVRAFAKEVFGIDD